MTRNCITADRLAALARFGTSNIAMFNEGLAYP
jgi:hypothetical protein